MWIVRCCFQFKPYSISAVWPLCFLTISNRALPLRIWKWKLELQPYKEYTWNADEFRLPNKLGAQLFPSSNFQIYIESAFFWLQQPRVMISRFFYKGVKIKISDVWWCTNLVALHLAIWWPLLFLYYKVVVNKRVSGIAIFQI